MAVILPRIRVLPGDCIRPQARDIGLPAHAFSSAARSARAANRTVTLPTVRLLNVGVAF
jgi:hypothetical protein